MWHSRDEDIFELVGADHGVVVQNGSGGHVASKDVIGDVIEGLLSGFILVHVEGVVDFRGEDALPHVLIVLIGEERFFT